MYQLITKSDISPLVDFIGGLGICSNTLLNSLVLLIFDGSVQSSALEMLGLEEWWRQKYSKNEKIVAKLEDIKMENAPKPEKMDRRELMITTQEMDNPAGSIPAVPSNQMKMNDFQSPVTEKFFDTYTKAI